MSTPDEAIAAVSSRQGGVIDRAQLEALGLGRGAIGHRIDVGRLRWMHEGVYAVGHEALQLRGRLFAASLVAGPGAALSHRTAAFLHRILRSMPQFVDLSVAVRRRDRPGLRFHRTRAFEARMLHGLPTTTPARTLRDLAATIALPELACSEALIRKLVTTAELACQTGHGSTVLRRLVADDLAPTQSELERRFLRLARDHDLPRPECQVQIGAHRAASSTAPNGSSSRSTASASTVTGSRPSATAPTTPSSSSPAAVLRFSWDQVRHHPQLVAARVARALSARRAMRTAS